ncbi:MAG: membrane glycosyltransferase [Marinobacter excellens HL-55]|uniref:Glucans biosynthesis glucosyltransferase H n=1 Tax=Marinobacter excellens HL-55 TaxID=1305731 RepID=A0A0P8D4D5_9GAMM|nr:MAG: membrane glycosyltransferase [Marinobacter excellens HL-55]
MALTEPRWHSVAFRRRLLLALLVLGQTAAGVWLLTQNVSAVNSGWPAGTLVGVFTILFTWIGLGFWTAVFGFVMLRRGGDPLSLSRRFATTSVSLPIGERVALVMPICHEPVQRTLGNLNAVCQDLDHGGLLANFDVYVLSDSQEPETWLEEQAACADMNARLGGGRLFYRRRRVNLKYKSGNIADFLRRWGARYRYMVVLDADSLLSAEAIRRLLGLMEQRPQAGIIQTAPRLARADTRFARLQQFANRCYGRIHCAGLAAIQLGDANYWGHNAIIRVAPFMEHCGLRQLRGWGLFRGPVLSHDYLESALMGRAGYEVWLEPSISGSFEESPPTLKDDLIRDRRWCRGNLQHLAPLLTLSKLKFCHRVALITGILSYLASPLWLVFLSLSAYLSIASASSGAPLTELINASPASWSLTESGLVGLTITLLLGPRILALIDQGLAGRSQGFGGWWRLMANTALETLVSILLAPIRMIVHSGHVAGALLNRNLQWRGQNRTGAVGFAEALKHFVWPALACTGLLALIHWYAPDLTPWALPVTLPLLMAPVLMLWLASLANPHWMTVPETESPTPVISSALSVQPQGKRLPTLSWFEQAVLSPHYRGWRHRRPPVKNGCKQTVLSRLVDQCAEQGSGALTPDEISLLCEHPDALASLHVRAWHSKPGSPWGSVLARLDDSFVTQRSTAYTAANHNEDTAWIGVAS